MSKWKRQSTRRRFRGELTVLRVCLLGPHQDFTALDAVLKVGADVHQRIVGVHLSPVVIRSTVIQIRWVQLAWLAAGGIVWNTWRGFAAHIGI